MTDLARCLLLVLISFVAVGAGIVVAVTFVTLIPFVVAMVALLNLISLMD